MSLVVAALEQRQSRSGWKLHCVKGKSNSMTSAKQFRAQAGIRLEISGGKVIVPSVDEFTDEARAGWEDPYIIASKVAGRTKVDRRIVTIKNG